MANINLTNNNPVIEFYVYLDKYGDVKLVKGKDLVGNRKAAKVTLPGVEVFTSGKERKFREAFTGLSCLK